MPTSQSAKKRMRQSAKRHEHNKKYRTRLRTFVNKFQTAIENGDLDEAEALLPDVESAYDRAASKNVIPKDRAARKVGRLKSRLHQARQS
ncbi:MAG: 30S ribosomal protein S20 [Myxococcota bacterium]